ncbi:MAG: GNAT family N-acetyltransferase [Proteocatella sp.]
MYTFEIVKLEDLNIKEYYDFEDKLIYQTLPWIHFLMETQKVEPIIVKISLNDSYIGYYTGFLFSKFGIKIIGSPFRGWTTLYMGFNLQNGVERAAIVNPLWKFLSKKYHCLYMEIIDRYITNEDVENNGLIADVQETYIKDISSDIDTIHKSFSSTCKNQIRRYEKNDAVLKVCKPSDDFAETYYEQLVAVFGYQNLIPTYDVNRVKVLLRELSKLDGALYCTEMFNPEGKSIGTLLGFAYNTTCYLFGLASYREEKYYQADYLVWDSFMHWKELGYKCYDLVGVREYKLKFHPELITVPRIICCKAKVLITLRNLALKLYWKFNAINGKLKK